MGTVAEYLNLRKNGDLIDDPVLMAKRMGLLDKQVLTCTIDQEECERLYIEWQGWPLTIKRLGNVVADYNLNDRFIGRVGLALAITPEVVKERLSGRGIINRPEIVLQNDELGNKSEGACVVLDDNDQPSQIRISLKGLRIVRGLDPELSNPLDGLMCFAATAHEVADWIQGEYGLHDCLHRPNDDDSMFRAKHAKSRAERFSNQVATDLTRIIFGWKVILS